MFSTCIHCQQPLGANESIEAFPVGRRLAFDEAKGRLWVVCRKCERWNLSPLDERWEAIEACERAFRGTRVRVSTDNIGLAKLRDGTELVRVGTPMRPEFAAWRYGDQFGRRRKRFAMFAGAAVVGVGAVVVGGIAAGASLSAASMLLNVLNLGSAANHVRRNTQRQPAIPLRDGTLLEPVLGYRPHVIVRKDVANGWGVRFGGLVYQNAAELDARYATKRWDRRRVDLTKLRTVHLDGSEAEAVVRWALPEVNRFGASPRRVSDSVGLIERVVDPARFGTWLATQLPIWRARQRFVDDGDVKGIPATARLAFEMALNEDSERRALEGELHVLEAAWRDADAIAKIADDMFVAPNVEARLEALRTGGGVAAGPAGTRITEAD
jgi:hypothetical protein